MDKELIKGLIAEYQQFVKSVSFVKRAVTLSDNFNYVFVGLRRVGKSYLMYQQIHHLIETGISPEEIHGYDREAATHMAVAAAVSGGDADAGMGIQSAARAMGLDFIEIGREEYDFAIPVRFLDFPPVQHFLAVLKSREFAEGVEKLGGYGLARTGEILYL